jgi:hypothetical protein
MTALKFFSLVLACYRLTRLIVFDDGPFDVFAKLRVWAGVYDYASNGRQATQLGRLLGCPYCTGMYAAALVWFLPEWLVMVLAVAGGQSWVQSMITEQGRSKADR